MQLRKKVLFKFPICSFEFPIVDSILKTKQMATIRKFEDLDIWQLARQLSKEIKLLTDLDAFSKEFKLKDQMKRSSGSNMDNIAEGFDRNSRLEFINFLSIAKGSCGELKSQLYRCLDYNILN